MGKKITQDEFIQKAVVVHGDKYDYSQIEYKNVSTKVKIICPKHGEFWQQPRMHIAGQQCPKCAHIQRAETCVERYGTPYMMTTSESLEKSKDAVRQKYGVDNVFQLDSVKEKSKATCLQRYGVENATQSSEIMERIQQTNLQRYGVPCSMQNEDVKARHREAVKEHYGVENPSQSSAVRARAVDTLMTHYGVDNPCKSDDILDKIKATCLEKYGVEYVFQSDSVREQIIQTFLDKYGVENPWMSDEIREKIAATCRERYGVDNPTQSMEVLEKIYDTKRKNHTFHTSVSEEYLYGVLVSKFGESDVLRQYKSGSYPFACDFYIKSKDLYVELNATWTHGGHWFGGREDDTDVLSAWNEKAIDSEYYQNAVRVWTERDVVKRSAARQNNLNYIVFWDYKLRDAELWFSLGCPDGQDWQKEYSWLEKMEF